ncbi:MAG: class I SAM-dependent methyltransferase [Thermoplasmata archaeon]|nr:class I SAM-dependent methyltransferase [Thermoplasmata archaeon]
MNEDEPSATALRVAGDRASHQWLDSPKVLDDPLAVRILPPPEAARIRGSRTHGFGPVAVAMRAWMVARSRFAEDELARARDRGVVQYVVLGAGLDTFAYRPPLDPRPLQVFEVDHPATQRWKRRRLEEAAVPVPASVTFVPTDFERGRLAVDLERAGFDRSAPAFFAWLGVTMYLTPEAIAETLSVVASAAPGGGVALDYFSRRTAAAPLESLAHAAIARRVAQLGEPFRSWFPPGELADRLRSLGFRGILDLGRAEVNARYFRGRTDRLRVYGTAGHLLSAVR